MANKTPHTIENLPESVFRHQMRLSDLELRFAINFMNTKKKTQSYLDACNELDHEPVAVPKKAGHDMSRKRTVVAFIDAVRQAQAMDGIWDSKDKLIKLQEVVERTMQAAPVVIGGEVIEGEYQFDSKGAISGIAEHNKMRGDHASQKHEVTGAGGGPIEHAVIVDEETMKVAVKSVLSELWGAPLPDATDADS